MASFDKPYTTFYWSVIVSIALSGTIFSYLMLNDTIVTNISSLSKSVFSVNIFRLEYTIVLLLFSLMTDNNKLLYFDV